MKILSLVILIGIMFSGQELYAQTFIGCRSSGSIYRTPPSFLYGWTNPLSENCPLNAANTVQYARFIRNEPAPNSCPVGLLSLGGTGVLVEYRILFCSFDRSVPYLLFPVIFTAILLIRKMPHARNEIPKSDVLNKRID